MLRFFWSGKLFSPSWNKALFESCFIFFFIIIGTITVVPSPPPWSTSAQPLSSLPSGRHHTIVCDYGLCRYVLWLISSPPFLQPHPPSPLWSSSYIHLHLFSHSIIHSYILSLNNNILSTYTAPGIELGWKKKKNLSSWAHQNYRWGQAFIRLLSPTAKNEEDYCLIHLDISSVTMKLKLL